MSDEQLARQDIRDLTGIESAAHDVLRQCEFLRRNGGGDEIRFGLIADYAWKTWRIAARADRRWAKAKGWMVLRWHLPRGYGSAG